MFRMQIDIYNIVVNISNNNNVTLTDDEINTIVNLLQQISQQDYDYSEMQETLERVNDNVTGQAEESSDSSDDEDSIVDNVDQSALGDNVIESSTEDPGLAEETGETVLKDPGSFPAPTILASTDEVQMSQLMVHQ